MSAREYCVGMSGEKNVEVFHGPYPAIPTDEIIRFVIDHCGYAPGILSAELEDAAQSINQYEQHCAAVKDAMRAGRIEAGIGHFMMAKTLKPWDSDLRYLVA